MKKLIIFVINFLLNRDSGQFSLGFGKYKAMKIPLAFTPKKFFFSIEENCESGCGHSTLSAYNYKIIKNAVLFYANVQAANAKITWIAKY